MPYNITKDEKNKLCNIEKKSQAIQNTSDRSLSMLFICFPISLPLSLLSASHLHIVSRQASSSHSCPEFLLLVHCVWIQTPDDQVLSGDRKDNWGVDCSEEHHQLPWDFLHSSKNFLSYTWIASLFPWILCVSTSYLFIWLLVALRMG